jgi:hypothetical protein
VPHSVHQEQKRTKQTSTSSLTEKPMMHVHEVRAVAVGGLLVFRGQFMQGNAPETALYLPSKAREVEVREHADDATK